MRRANDWLLIGAIVVTSLLAACTRMPVDRKGLAAGNHSQAAGSEQLDYLSQAIPGESLRISDSVTGEVGLITVTSEYFSANGRLCRRYLKKTSSTEITGLGCRQKNGGWIAIPLQND